MDLKLAALIDLVTAMAADYPKGSEARGDLAEVAARLHELAKEWKAWLDR